MKKMMTAFMLLLISFGGLSQTVHANSALGELDANMLFGQSSYTVDVMALSEREMLETEGEWFLQSAGALLGGLGTTFGYWSSSNNRTFGGTAAAFFGGAAAGAVNPIRGIGTGIRNLGGGFLGGYSAGSISNFY